MPGGPGMGLGDGVVRCTNGIGGIGKPLVVAHNGPAVIKYTGGLEQIALRSEDPLEEIVPFINTIWHAIPGPEIGVATRNAGSPFKPNGIIRHEFVLHPESLDAEMIRILIEYRVTGQNPLLFAAFGLDDPIMPFPSLPVPLGDGWFARDLTVVRPQNGEPMGVHLDMLDYETRDIEVRRFEVQDLGIKGDVNLDGQVDALDLQIVLNNMFMTGQLTIEDGDTDLSGSIDATDVVNIIQAIGD